MPLIDATGAHPRKGSGSALHFPTSPRCRDRGDFVGYGADQVVPLDDGYRSRRDDCVDHSADPRQHAAVQEWTAAARVKFRVGVV